MHIKGIALLTSLFLLAACGGENTEEPDTEASVVETEAINIEETNNDSVEESDVVHTYDGLVDQTTFTNEYGLQAWDDYQAIIKDTVLGEVSVNVDEIIGTSKSEVEGLFDAIDLREDVFKEELELSEVENLTLYRYPPAEDSEYSDAAMFLAELTFYFYEDHLMFSAITPGFYSVELNDVPSANDLMLLLTVDEIKELDPQIYTISEMQINGEKIQQVMTPAMSTDENGNETLMAFYFFTRGEDILQYGFLPFEMVSQDFPTSSILLFQEIIPELEKL